MSNRRGPNLAQRSAATRVAEGGADLEELRRRHCWVIGPAQDPGPWPGLVLEWHRDAEGWRARVVYLTDADGAQTVVQTWLDARLLRPA